MAQWIHYIGGRASAGKLVAVAIGMSDDPETEVASFEGTQPFSVELLGLEEGSQERLEALRARFSGLHLNGPWYKAATGLKAHLETLKPVDRGAAKPKRVSLDLTARDFRLLNEYVTESGSTTKQRFLRRAYKGYGQLCRYEAQGYQIQALKDGRLVRFENGIDRIPDPLEDDE